ncbi:MAG: type II secretion system protein GspG [Xanthomonadales bacterium]|nr:type II secretion system protein GspG [Xanthomonadales bacterium]
MTTRTLRRARPLPRNAGFTLMEMIAVIVLLGIVIAIVGGNVMDIFGGGKWQAGTVAVEKLENAVNQYQMGTGKYPDSLQDLLKKEGMCPCAKEADLKDPFGHAYVYKKPGDAGRDFDLVFLGKDGKAGGEGQDKDYGSWEK